MPKTQACPDGLGGPVPKVFLPSHANDRWRTGMEAVSGNRCSLGRTCA